MSSKSKKTHEAISDRKTDQVIPWSEWSDSELNTEKWDNPKNGIDGSFADPEPRLMPPSIEPHEWRRGFKLNNLSSNPVVFTPSNDYPDFVKNNEHILHSEFVRWFISTMINLQYIGRNGLKLEEEQSSLPWRGWMYVHSMNKVGNGVSEHRPIVNPNGKYIVRLFFMGFWRRFVVDDMIPVDVNGTPLLPRTGNDFELWPMLLAKAMIKLASLSWTTRREINDFCPVSCLTGWIGLPLMTRRLPPNEKWQLFGKYVDGVAEENQNSHSSILIFARIGGELSEEAVHGVTPCLSHVVHVEKLRDLTVESSQGRWKAYRYFDWLKRRGAGITGTENSPCFAPRSLKLICALGHRATRTEDNVEVREIEVWADFVQLAPYLEELTIFYKPSDFQYHSRVSDLLKTSTVLPDSHAPVTASAGSRIKSQANAAKESKRTQANSGTAAFLNSLKWEPDKVSSCTNDPLFMLVDSVESKFFLIDFCSMQRQGRPESCGSYLSIEKYDFFGEPPADNEPIALIKTRLIGATIFEAAPGRHLYRLLFRPGCRYFARISSQTIFHLGDRYRIYDLMTSESERIDAVARNISDRISSALLEFGKPGYAVQLRLFYESYKYMPNVTNSPRSAEDNIHRQFLEELAKLIKETFSLDKSPAICRALRIFFIDPSIGVSIEDKTTPENSIYDIAASRIQSFFRMLLIKSYKNLHSPSHPKHTEIVDSLRKVVELFDYETKSRESIGNLLTRRIVQRSTFHPLRDDLTRVLNVEEFKGISRNVQPNQWVPLARVVANSPSSGISVRAAIDLVTSLTRYVVRVVDNESHIEIKRIGNKVATADYPYVNRGYTIFAYGWSDGLKFKELDWRLRLTTVKGHPTFVTKLQNFTVQESSGIYVPNVTNIFGKWIVDVRSDSLLSLRLSTSYEHVETAIKIIDVNDELIFHQAQRGSALVLPAVFLPFSILAEKSSSEGEDHLSESRSRSNTQIANNDEASTRYYVQAYVANDSWPLTPTEWTVVNETKAKGTVYDPGYGRTSVLSRRGIRSRLSLRGGEDKQQLGEGEPKSDGSSTGIWRKPFYRLQIVADVGNEIRMEIDRRLETEIAALKKSWEQSEPGRLLRGAELREEFFKDNSIENVSRFSELPAEEEIRTLKPVKNLSRLLPPWNILAYVIEDEEDQRWLKTEGDEEILRNQRAINVLDFNQTHAANTGEYEALINEQRQRYFRLFDSYAKKVNDWNNLAEVANEKRENYVNEFKLKLKTDGGKNAKDKDKIKNNKNKNKNKK